MNIFSENKNLYPTPDHLASRMIGKIEGYPKNILESQAGFGHLVEALQKHWPLQAPVNEADKAM